MTGSSISIAHTFQEAHKVEVSVTYIQSTIADKTFIAQELNAQTHPHLQLDRTMVSAPRLSPGDQVYCEKMSHCLFKRLT